MQRRSRTYVPASGGGAPVALQLRGVAHTFGRTCALAALDLEVHRGAACVVTGTNGSGKTTLLRVAAGALTPTSGSVRRAGIGLYLRSGGGAHSAQSVREAITFVAYQRGGDPTRAVDILDRCGLAPLANAQVGSLSAGQRARVTLAVAATARAAVTCLDEPTAQLDADGVAVVRQVVRELLDDGRAVLVSTHDLNGVADMADAFVRLHRGAMTAI